MPTQYTVRSGDTLSKIGQQFGVDYNTITGYRSGDPNKIYPGEVLTIGSTGQTGTAPAAPNASPNTVGAVNPGLPGAQTGTNASGSSSSTQQITGGGTAPVGDLGNMRAALRDALNEAARKRVENNFKMVAPLAKGRPGTIGGVVDMIRAGIQTPVENTFSDVMKTFEERKKDLEKNPANYKSVQGGLYDISTNEWIIPPKAGGGTSGRTLSRTDVQSMGLPVGLVGTSWNTLQTQLQGDNPPSWFTPLVGGGEPMPKIQPQGNADSPMGEWQYSAATKKWTPTSSNKGYVTWEQFKNEFNNSFEDSGDSGDFFDDL